MKNIDELREEWIDSATKSIKECTEARASAKSNPELAKDYEKLASIHEKQAKNTMRMLAELSTVEKLIEKKKES